MKHVLYIASNMTHIKDFHLEMIRSLSESACAVDLACRDVPARVDGARACFDVPFTKRLSLLKNRGAIRMLRRIIDSGGYDVLFCNTTLAAFFARLVLLGKRRRPYVVNMVHGYLFDEKTPAWKRTVMTAAERVTAPVTDLVLTMNDWDTDYARRKKTGKRIRKTRGFGFAFSRFPAIPAERAALRRALGLPEDVFLLVYPAEFSARKNQLFLLGLLKELPEHICLALPGDGAGRASCEAFSRENGLADRVFFPGYQTDLNPWYRAADAAVSSSRTEGLPSILLEAMYCGLPVVASRIKGHTDLIREGQTGYLCADGAEFCARIRSLAADGGLCRRMGEAGARLAREYAREDCVRELLSELRALGVFPELPDAVRSRDRSAAIQTR